MKTCRAPQQSGERRRAALVQLNMCGVGKTRGGFTRRIFLSFRGVRVVLSKLLYWFLYGSSTSATKAERTRTCFVRSTCSWCYRFPRLTPLLLKIYLAHMFVFSPFLNCTIARFGRKGRHMKSYSRSSMQHNLKTSKGKYIHIYDEDDAKWFLLVRFRPSSFAAHLLR